MPISHEWNPPLLVTRYTGKVTGEELIQEAISVSGDPRFDSLRYIIGDWTGATESETTPEDVEKLAVYIEQISRSNPNVKNATITYNRESSKALAALYLMLTETTSWKTEMFNTMEGALNWCTGE